MIYLGADNVIRKVSQGYVGRAGVVRPLYDGYCGAEGVKRQFMGGKVTADMIEKLELAPSYLSLYTVDSGGSAKFVEETQVKSAADLSAYSGYGSVIVDAGSRTVTVTGNKTGYQIQLRLNLYVTWKTGARELLSESLIGKLDDPKFTAYFYVGISSGSGAHGWYNNYFCGVNCGIGSFTGSASKTMTAAPESYYSYLAAGITGGAGTETTQLTLQNFTIGGKQILPKITYIS